MYRIIGVVIYKSTKISIMVFLSKKKSRSRETQNVSTDADRSTNISFWKKRRKKFNPERLLVFKALWVGPQVHQSSSWTPPMCGPSTGTIWNYSLFLGLYESVNECTSRTPPTRRQSMYAIQNNSLFLGLYELVDECTSPPVEHLPTRVSVLFISPTS